MSADYTLVRRPAGVFVLGVLHIVFGTLYFLLTSCGGLLMLAGVDKMAARGPAGGMTKYVEEQYPTLMSVGRWLTAVNLAVAVLLVVAGTGLLRLRPWARRASFVYAGLHAVLLVYSMVVTRFFVYPAMGEYIRQESARDPALAATAPFVWVSQVSSLVVGLVMLAYPLAVVVILLRQPVREAFAAADSVAAGPEAPAALRDDPPAGTFTDRLPPGRG